MKLTLGYSPCPNDTFMMNALVHGLIDTGPYEFEVIMADVEELNERAMRENLDLTKLSYHAYTHLTDKYRLLNSGSALGRGVGPLLIANQPIEEADLINGPIALPGKWTTAHLLFSLRFPRVKNKQHMVFSEVENAVASGEVKAGVIIHENRFTYAERGFVKLIDLGEYWESLTEQAIPLGGIVAHRRLPPQVIRDIDGLLQRSIDFAFEQDDLISDYVREHAQEMDEKVMKQHIQLYVNDYSRDLGPTGRSAVQQLMEHAKQKGLIDDYSADYLIA